MRVPRVLLIACPLLLGACGMIAGLDGYTEGDNLTADGGAKEQEGSSFVAPDAGGGANADAQASSLDDGSVVTTLEAATDAPLAHDTGPASDAACILTKNGGGCNGNATNCCSTICDETGTCNGNACVANNNGCSNKVAFVISAPPYYRAQGPCCVKQFCNPKANQVQDGFCNNCIPKGQQPPQRTVTYFDPIAGKNKTAPVIYDDACCSGSVENDGNCK